MGQYTHTQGRSLSVHTVCGDPSVSRRDLRLRSPKPFCLVMMLGSTDLQRRREEGHKVKVVDRQRVVRAGRAQE